MIYNMFQWQVSTAEYPEPFPTKGHRPDWIIKHRGAPLPYGEGKAVTGINEPDTCEGFMLLVYLCKNQLNFSNLGLGMITMNINMQFIHIEKCAKDVQRCHVKICEGFVHSTACKVKFFNDTPAKKKHHAKSNIVAEELPTLSFYTRQNDTMGDGHSLNCIQLPINYSSHNDVCLYKNLIYPKALRMSWYHLNIALQKYLVAIF